MSAAMSDGSRQSVGDSQRRRDFLVPCMVILHSKPVPETGRLACLWNHLTPLRLADTFMAFFGALIGAYLSGAMIERSVPLWSVAVSVTLLSGASMIFNDWKDYPIDRINKPERAIAAHRVDRRVALLLAALLFLTAVVLAFVSHPLAGACALAIFLLSVGYTLFLKRVPLLGNAAVGIAGASPLWIWLPFSTDPTPLYLALIVGLMLVNTGREIARSVDDIPGDRAYGVRTVANTLGPGASAFVCMALTVLALAVAWWPPLAGGVDWAYLVALVLSSLLVAGGLFRCVRLPRDRWAGHWAGLCRVITVTVALGCAAAILLPESGPLA